MKKLRVTVEGKTYEVTVETIQESGAPVAAPASAPIKLAQVTAPAASAPAPKPVAAPAAAAGANDVCSPLAGKIVSVDTKVGETVAEGAQLVTIEAMKMNTHIYAHRAGKIAAITVAAGDSVSEGQVLVSFA